MKKEDIAYCGLNCAACKSKFADIKVKAGELQSAMESVNFGEIAKVIPFMKSKYRGFNKTMDFLNNEECSGCRSGGGNPFCGIRKCASKKKHYETCAECEKLCKKFNLLYKVHSDNEIQNNIEAIQRIGLNGFVEDYNRRN